MRQTLIALATTALLAGSGCVTPMPVKEASTRHKTNLGALATSVGSYQKALDAYYDRLIGLQREAYVSQHMTAFIHQTATEQAQSLKSLDAESAADFISAGAAMGDGFDFWAANFDFWMAQKGDTLAAKKELLLKRAAELEPLGPEGAQAAKNLKAQASRSEDELSYIHVATELQSQKRRLRTQLSLLAAQVGTMQAFHSVIDEYLAIDATIDGGKIAEAAAAGSNVDVSGLLGGGSE